MIFLLCLLQPGVLPFCEASAWDIRLKQHPQGRCIRAGMHDRTDGLIAAQSIFVENAKGH